MPPATAAAARHRAAASARGRPRRAGSRRAARSRPGRPRSRPSTRAWRSSSRAHSARLARPAVHEVVGPADRGRPDQLDDRLGHVEGVASASRSRPPRAGAARRPSGPARPRPGSWPGSRCRAARRARPSGRSRARAHRPAAPSNPRRTRRARRSSPASFEAPYGLIGSGRVLRTVAAPVGPPPVEHLVRRDDDQVDPALGAARGQHRRRVHRSGASPASGSRAQPSTSVQAAQWTTTSGRSRSSSAPTAAGAIQVEDRAAPGDRPERTR